MTRMDIAIALGFAVFWSISMIWWSQDYTIVNIVIFSVMGLLVGFAWVWVMKRWGYFK